MSDLLNSLEMYKYKQKITISTDDHCLKYLRETCVPANNIIYTMNIPNEHLTSH